MKIAIYKSLWGMEGTLESHFRSVSETGYEGIESAIAEMPDREKLKRLLTEYSLDYIPLIYTEGNSITDHIEDFRRLVGIASAVEPAKIVAHAGRDLWSFEDQCHFFEEVLKIEQEIGIPIAHETHRRRPLFSPMNAVRLFKQFPELKINADLSHWCCVTESMLEDHSEAIELAIKRTIHIHCRVGYENGPQVSDPRIKQWAEHLEKFEGWWSEMVKNLDTNNELITVTPEYGPPTYMPTTLDTNKPVADLMDICLWSAERFRRICSLG